MAMSVPLDSLGPYSIPQLREVAAHIQQADPAYSVFVTRAQEAGKNTADVFERLRGGQSVVLLWRQTPKWGHFVALVPRRDTLEFFDPLGGEEGAGGVARQFFNQPGGKVPAVLNGTGPWLPELFRRWAAETGQPISYNVSGPQDDKANSCGLWCLRRVLRSDLSPSDFQRRHGQ